MVEGVFQMKNLIKLFGLIALAAVIGFSMTACPADAGDSGSGNGSSGGNTPITIGPTNGQLTVNNLTGYNSKWIVAIGANDAETVSVFAADNITGTTSANIAITGKQIANDSAVLKVWQVTESSLGNYTGSDSINILAAVISKQTLNASEFYQLVAAANGGTLPSFFVGGGTMGIGGKVAFSSGIGSGSIPNH
jgi:hypothetical protein